ncbi:MAG TPA: MBL fold metallo-hydrolase [Pyrinomonadaceae bacterium]|jgi:glyoxylase-like metal-dependent hydrolase (beta-lactamase superfamily II)
MRVNSYWLVLVILLAPSLTKAQGQKLEVVKITDGVYAALVSEPRFDPVESNAVILINNDSVLVVDANRTPAAARATIAEIRKLTDKPVRYVVNTHWHDDHIFGNQSYLEAFPQVEFIAHQNTREDMKTLAFPHIQRGIERWTKVLADAENQSAKGVKPNGEAMSAQEKAELRAQLEVYREFLPKIKTIKLTLPTMTFDKRLTLHQGTRTIEILYFGNGNTRGDVVVYLPQEKVLIIGDLLVHPVPYAYGSFIKDWVGTMKRVREIDAQVIIPGHGPVLRDKEYMNIVIALLESVTKQVEDAVKRGLSLEETRKAVNLESFRLRLAGTDAVRNDTFNTSILQSAINQAYKQAKAEAGSK